MKLLDFLLLPRSVYQKVTGKKPLLYAGILFIGFKNIVFSLHKNYSGIFGSSVNGSMTYNILITLAFIIVLGVTDVTFFALPLNDLFKRFKKESNPPENENQLVRLMKVYILAHFAILPVEILIYILFRDMEIINNSLIYIILVLDLVIPVWFSAAISRGINTIYSFQPLFKWLVFIVVYIWISVLSWVFFYAIENWMMVLYR